MKDVEIDDGDEGEGSLIELSPIVMTLSPDERGERLDKVLSKLVPQYSRSRIQQWIEAGRVTVDGQPGKGKRLRSFERTAPASGRWQDESRPTYALTS